MRLRTTKARRSASLTRPSGMEPHTSQPTTLREQRSSLVAKWSQPPSWRGKYVMSPIQTWLGVRETGWPNKRLGAAHTAESESVVRSTNARGC